MSDAPETASTAPMMALRAQYVKDLSFENPRAPHTIFGLKAAPEMEISVNLGAKKLDEAVTELALHINLSAVAEGAPVFTAELVYAGVFELRNLPQEEAEKALFIAGANLLYPFARRVVSDVTRDGGFPPVQLEPIDFATLYYTQRDAKKAS